MAAKRRFIQFLPAWNQTEDLTSFFSVTVDQVFQPGQSDQISGYIGRKPQIAGVVYHTVGNTPTGSTTLTFTSTAAIEVGEAISGNNIAANCYIVNKTDTVVALNKPTLGPIPDNSPVILEQATDFYIGEPSASRAAYQLESGMITLDSTGTINNALTYPDLINYLASEGAIVTDHQRLFEQEFYSFGPPINIDMILNYRNYRWFGDPSGKNDLPILTLNIPYNIYQGDGVTNTFAMPNSINAVPVEQPTVYVDGYPVLFGISEDSVVIDDTPSAGSTILVARVFDFVSVIGGATTAVDISDINSSGVTNLSSGMRVRVLDMFHLIGSWDGAPLDSTLWDESGDEIYMVDGVGQSVRFTDNSALLYDVEAQYVTIDRSSRQTNLWSLHNLWVHKDTYAWSGQDFPERRAVRPIIEFVRDIVLYPDQVWSESIDPLFMLYDLIGNPYNDPSYYPISSFKGNRIFGFASGNAPLDPILHRHLKFDANGYIVFEVDATTHHYTYVSGTSTNIITSLPCYRLDDRSTIVTLPMWFRGNGTTPQGESNGFWNVPLNLQANPSSLDVSFTSASTYTPHFESIIGNQTSFTGQPLGDNNYRDTERDLGRGNTILQHRAPLLKTMLLASNTTFDLVQAIRYNDQEYNRFRNKFARKIVDLSNRGAMQGIDPTENPTEWVITALTELRRDKNSSFPFASPNMIGGDEYFIPATPSALGIQPAAVPCMVTDTTYSTPVLMIQGHDGSLTPAFNDPRDPVMLELERLIYRNLPAQFQTEARPGFDIQQWIGGRFFAPENGYSRDELNTILTPMFELWAQYNHFDFRTNKTYDADNPFTWNYHGVVDRFGNPLPGNWRAIYRWYYNTDSPHTRPWELLGFVSQPAWWIDTYGPAPYVRSNIQLWSDLERGVIAAGPRAGIDTSYERPGLADLIPVDENGHLLDPVAIGIVTTNVSYDVASASWQVGDHGPVENLWITSPSYCYALAIASFLMKPARFVEQCWDVLNIGFIGDQWVELASSPRTPFTRPLNSAQYVFGETLPSGIISNMTGISQWISDYLASTGQTSDLLGAVIRTLDVRLIHQMAGFVALDNLRVVADNFGLVPSENIHSILYSSPIFDSEVYSGVILEWTGRSWRVIGYDGRNPWFTIIPGDPYGPKGVISLATTPEPDIVPWRPNTYYPLNILAVYLNSVYECKRSHTSGPHFESNYWMARPDLAASMLQAPRVVTYLRGLNTTKRVMYGTEFSVSYQEVADFLLGWERWLVSRGWIFDTVDETSGLLRNWSLAVREFLQWAQVKWKPGNFIALSPGMQGLRFSTATGTILNVEDNVTGFFGLIDRHGQPISNRNAIVNRLDGNIKLSARDADIFCARVEIVEIEHALVFDNTSVFDDIIYLPLFDQRQTRLRLICTRAKNWVGRLDASGFVIIGNQLKSNFDKAVEDIRMMFDIELSDRSDLRAYARHVVGFQERDYLDNLLLSGIEQFEFYQGMIQQKGTPGAFQRLMRSNRASNHSNLRFLEEWAIRLGEFGAPIDPFFTLALYQLDVRDDPQLIRFTGTKGAPRDWIIVPPRHPRWVDPPPSPASFFPLLKGYPSSSLPTAGPVRLDEVEYTAFSIDDVPEIYKTCFDAGTIPFPTGSSTWVYKRADGTYTVLRSFEVGVAPNAILTVLSNIDDSTVTTSRIVFQHPMTLTENDIGNYLVIDGSTSTSPELQGLQTITAVDPDSNSVDLMMILTTGYDFAATPDEAPFVRVLREVRFANRNALNSASMQFQMDDLVWIDADSNGLWTVLQWTGVYWIIHRSQPPRPDPYRITETVIYELSTTIQDRLMFMDKPVVDDVVVIDPLAGLIAGIAARELDYRTEYDPARYNAGTFGFAANPWGQEEVGRVWWDLSTVRFLDPFTDVIGASDPRDLAELTYRTANWSRIAPKTSVDVYEWVESIVDPLTYSSLAASDTTGQYSGRVYNAAAPSWVEVLVFDRITQQTVTLYYFWVAGRNATPIVPFRHIDVSTVALAIENPSALDLQWLAPIHSDSLIISGVLPFLDDKSTVLKVRLLIVADEQERNAILASADFKAPNDTLLQDYVSPAGTSFTQIDDTSDAEIREDALIGSGGTTSYQVDGHRPSSPNYTLQFVATPTLHTTASSAGTEIYAIGRAVDNLGYKVAVASSGIDYSLVVSVLGTPTTVSVSMGTISSGYFVIKMDMQTNRISASVQRSSDGNWLGADSSWQIGQRSAVSIIDGTYTNPGKVIIGGTW